jgi:hypothetical protein
MTCFPSNNDGLFQRALRGASRTSIGRGLPNEFRRRVSRWAVPALLVMTFGVGASGQTLHFKSGFDANSTVVNASGNPPSPLSDGIQIIGVDYTTGFDWVNDMVANAQNPGATRIGNFNFNLDTIANGAHITIVNDPTSGNRGKVMQFWLQHPTDVKGRIQTNVYDSDEDLNEVTSAVKLYLHSSIESLENMPTNIEWFTLQELWTNPNWELVGQNFRIGLGIHKAAGAGQPLYWHAGSDEAGSGGETFWSQNYSTAGFRPSDIIGQWVTLVMYYKKGNASTGRFKVKIIKADGSAQEVISVSNWTYHPTDSNQNTGLTNHNPHKMYADDSIFDYIRNNTSGGNGAAIIYWDDWEYYEGDAYTNYMPAPFSLTATAASSSQINLSWSNIPSETGFTIQRATNAAFSSGLTTSTTGANVTTFNSTALSAGTTYYYRVRGTIGGVVSDWSPVASATTQAAGGTTVTLYSIGAEDGNILESGENTTVGGMVGSSASNDIHAGDGSANKQYRSILSFDTSSLPDGATIQSATLRLSRSNITGTSPFSWGGQCRIDIRNGAFDGNAALAVADFQATASATNVAQMSNAASDNAWSTGSLNASGWAQINKTGKTQLRVYFSTDDNNNGSADFMKFRSGNAASNKPELVIVYQ